MVLLRKGVVAGASGGERLRKVEQRVVVGGAPFFDANVDLLPAQVRHRACVRVR